jgi:hypothetical protein
MHHIHGANSGKTQRCRRFFGKTVSAVIGSARLASLSAALATLNIQAGALYTRVRAIVRHDLRRRTDVDLRESPDFENHLALMPFLGLLYLIAYIDRQNVSFAKLEMVGALGMSEYAYGLGASLFFIGYFLFEVPSNLFARTVRRKQMVRPHPGVLGIVTSRSPSRRTRRCSTSCVSCSASARPASFPACSIC